MRALVECPQPLAFLLIRRFEQASHELRQLMLEVLTTRYYRIRTLTCIRHQHHANHSYLAAQYEYEGKLIHIFTTQLEHSELLESARSMFPLIEAVSPAEDVAVDFFVWKPGPASATPNRYQGDRSCAQ